jgi:hypothetical protein
MGGFCRCCRRDRRTRGERACKGQFRDRFHFASPLWCIRIRIRNAHTDFLAQIIFAALKWPLFSPFIGRSSPSKRPRKKAKNRALFSARPKNYFSLSSRNRPHECVIG